MRERNGHLRIFRQLVDVLTAGEQHGSPSRVGPPEDDVAGELPATAPPKHTRTASSKMVHRPSDGDARFHTSPRDIFGPRSGSTGRTWPGKGKES